MCGAQILAFAGADAIGTLTEEDAEVLAAYLPPDGVPITRVRYTTSSRDQPALPARARRSSGSGSSEGGVGGGRLVYVGSCHEANTAALAWLIEDVLPHLGRLLVGGGAWQLRVVGDVTMCDLWRGACKEEDCKAGRAVSYHEGWTRIRFFPPRGLAHCTRGGVPNPET